MEDTIIEDYRRRSAAAGGEAARFTKLANTFSLLRLGVFGLMILAVYLGIVNNDMTIMVVAFIVMIICFGWLVSRQGRFERLRNYFLDLKAVVGNELQSMQNGGNIYDNGTKFADDKHYYSADLDIFGKGSLFQLINRAATANGIDTLAGWLNAPSDKETILNRQEALREIGTKNSWKLDLQAKLLFAAKLEPDSLNKLLVYLNIPLNLKGEVWLNAYSRMAPVLLLLTIALSVFYPGLKPVPVLIGLINLGILASRAAYIKKADLIAGKIGKVLNGYAAVFENIEQETWQSAWCVGLSSALKNDGTSLKIKELARLIDKLNYHLNMIVGVVLNVFFLWDIRQIIAIENWKRHNRQNFEGAFEVVGNFEAAISLASLHINYQDWAFPEIASEQGYTLAATGIAHPLIGIKNRVGNDYALNDTFKIEIITGSNMAGKSTFLRTIGINTVLALAGAPVCATSMRVSVITIVSYMRIKDSLNESTSTFKAELDRLQMLLAAVEGKQKVFFLIDEMLRGTNSVDKYLGSKAVIEQLICKRGVGMVATHDLQIAQLEKKYPDYIRNFYFDIQIEDGEMLFDYKIKQGACKTFNASILLKQIGIDIDLM
jgi:hypothetical protein